jgi:hypothetical protein
METCLIKFAVTNYDLHPELRTAVDTFKEMYAGDKYFWRAKLCSITSDKSTTYWFMKVVDWYCSKIAACKKSNTIRCIYIIELYDFIQEHILILQFIGPIADVLITIAQHELNYEINTYEHKKYFADFLTKGLERLRRAQEKNMGL